MPHSLPLTLLPLAGSFAICQLPPIAPVPVWAADGPLLSVTRTSDELSIVCWQAAVPEGVKHVGGWSAWRIAGQFPFETTGVIRSLVEPLSTSADGFAAFRVRADADPRAALAGRAAASGLALRSLDIRMPTLEQAFIDIVGRE